MVAEGGSQSRLVVELGPNKPQLELVSHINREPQLFIIMNELLLSCDLISEQIYDYLSYTVKINELAESFECQSVPRYDQAG